MLTSKLSQEIERDGYAVTPSVFSSAELAKVSAACAELLEGTDKWSVLGAAARSAQLFEFAEHRIFRSICECMLGVDVDLYFDTIALKRAGQSKELRWHQDAAYGRTDPDYITCWTPLTPTDRESGGLWVSPGSHLQGHVPHRREAESAAAYWGPVSESDPGEGLALDVAAGQTVVLHSNLLHRSGPNLGTRDRLAYLCGYVSAGTRYLDPGLPQDARLPLFRGDSE